MILRKRRSHPRRSRRSIAAGGSDAREARLVAENLVTANLLGHDSHGIGMMPRYVDALLEGGLAANQHPKPTARRRRAARARRLQGLRPDHRPRSDGDGDRAREEARLVRHGARQFAPPRPHRALGGDGRGAGPGVDPLRQRDLARARRAVRAARDARFGTNPVCIGIPLPGEAPFLLDMATSAVAQGKMRVAHNKREKVPAGPADRRPGPSHRRSALRAWFSRSARSSPSAGTRATAWRWRASCSAAR